MKFYCDSCNTKYAISDDKVRGKVLKVRCKHCGNIITVRELEAVATPSPPVPSAKIPQSNWHFSINGKSTGPMGLGSLKAEYAAGEIGDETYVWHDTFDGWKPVATVAIFAEALGQGASKKPRFATRAYTGISEVVQAEPSKQRKGVAPVSSFVPEAKPELPKKAPKPKEETKPKPKKVTKPKTEVNEQRLDSLREKLLPSTLKKPEIKQLPLGSDKPKIETKPVLSSDSKSKPVLPAFSPVAEASKPTPASNTAAQPEPVKGLLKKNDLSLPPEAEPFGLGFSPTVPDTGPSFPGLAADPIADTMPPDDINSGISPMEEDDGLPDFGDLKPKNLFAAEADTYGLDVDSDVMPFFPEDANPSLGRDDAPSEVFASSKSLLIELDKIKKTDRKKTVFYLLGGLVTFVILGGVGGYMYSNRDVEEIAVVEKTQEREAKIIGYSKGEIAARFVQLDDVVIGKGEIEEHEEVKVKPSEKGTAKPKEKNNKTIPKSKEVAQVAQKGIKARGKSGVKTDEKSKLTTEQELRRKLLAIGSTPIKRPEDMLGSQAAVKTGLSRVQAQAGFKKVSRSVSTCRQRHANRSGKELESAKVKISVEVLPTGKVSTFRISPGNLRHTAFDSCMKSKKETWRFATFGGKPVKINRTFILQ